VRFLFPVLPLFNAAAAAALARFYNNRYKSPFSFILFLGCVGLVLITLAAKVVMTLAAYWNYPVRVVALPQAALTTLRRAGGAWSSCTRARAAVAARAAAIACTWMSCRQ